MSSQPPPATGTPHKGLLRGIYGPYFAEVEREYRMQQTVVFFVILSQLALMRIVFQSAKCCLGGQGNLKMELEQSKY